MPSAATQILVGWSPRGQAQRGAVKLHEKDISKHTNTAVSEAQV